MAAEQTVNGPLTKKQRSDVWQHYDLIIGQKKARCLLCNPHKVLAYHGGTSNLREHLVSQHPSVYSSKKKADPTQTSLNHFTKMKCSEARSKEITELITKMVAMDLRPLRLVEGEGFLKLMNYLEPNYKVPSAVHISCEIRKKHKAACLKLKDSLKENASSVSLTTDIWTSLANEAYITVSAHFISDWELHSVVLTTCSFPERHTGVEISKKLDEIATEFGIEEKVLCIVHDSASNMIRCMEILSQERNWSSLRCSAHALQLCVNSALNSVAVVDRLVSAAKKLVCHFKHSVVASEALKDRQKEMRIDEKSLFKAVLLGGVHVLKC